MIVSLPRFSPGSPLARTIPTATVVIAPIACLGAAISRNGEMAATGETVLAFCLATTVIFLLVRPRPLNPTANDPLDEREMGLRWKANAFGGAVVSLLGMAICFYMARATHEGWQLPSPVDWDHLLLLFLCWIIGMPMTFANWMVGKPLDDEDDQ